MQENIRTPRWYIFMAVVKGEILLEYHRMIDLEKREFNFVEKAPKELIQECYSKLKLMY